MAFRYAIAIAAVFVAIASLVAFGGVALYKTAANARRLMNNGTKMEGSLFGGDGSVRYALFESPDARHYVLPAVVQTQVIVNWIGAFCVAHMDVLKKRLDRASCQLIALHEAKRKAEIAMRFELVALTRVKWYLLDRSIGLTSVATQTPVSPTDNKQLRHVRFITPNLSYEQSEQLKTAMRTDFIDMYKRAKLIIMFVWVPLKWTAKYFKEPTALHEIAIKIADWYEKLLYINVRIDVAEDSTLLDFVVLPFFPERTQTSG